MKNKQIVALVAVIGFAFTACPTDDTPEETGELQFELINNGTAYRVDGRYSYRSVNDGQTITVYVGGEVIIPAYYNDLPVTSIGYFQECTRLTGVIIPATITSINWGAFFSCTGLTEITIPAGVTAIGANAFSRCTRLTNIIVADGNPHYASENGILYNKDKTTIVAYPSVSGDVTILEGVTGIGESAFSACSGLTSITIPASVTAIGHKAFAGSVYILDFLDSPMNLQTVTFAAGSQLTAIGDYAFSDLTSLTSITIPASVTEIGEGAFYTPYSTSTGYNNNLASVTFEAGSQLTTISSSMFFNCNSLTSINIPAGVTSIGGWAFFNCNSLTSINIPAGVTSIGGRAFFNCNSLTGITIPAGVTSIGVEAFSGCTKLLSVNIPAGVTSIGERAFAGFNTTQLITIRGKANQAAADAAWGIGWREDCNAIINYSE